MIQYSINIVLIYRFSPAASATCTIGSTSPAAATARGKTDQAFRTTNINRSSIRFESTAQPQRPPSTANHCGGKPSKFFIL